MGLEVIEMIIKESFRDGEITKDEIETLVKQGESYGIAKDTVIEMINAEKKNKELETKQKLKQQEEKEIAIALMKKEQEKSRKEFKKRQVKKNYDYNFSEWESDFDFLLTFVVGWGLLYGGIGLIVGVINAYTHNKGWGSYIGMSLLGLIYGYMVNGIVIGLSFLQKRKPLLDWYKPVSIAFGILVLFFIYFLVIPF